MQNESGDAQRVHGSLACAGLGAGSCAGAVAERALVVGVRARIRRSQTQSVRRSRAGHPAAAAPGAIRARPNPLGESARAASRRPVRSGNGRVDLEFPAGASGRPALAPVRRHVDLADGESRGKVAYRRLAQHAETGGCRRELAWGRRSGGGEEWGLRVGGGRGGGGLGRGLGLVGRWRGGRGWGEGAVGVGCGSGGW